MWYEHRSEALLSQAAYLARQARHLAASGVIVGFSLAVGTAGYHWLAHFRWIDAFLNASMLLGGMGPVGDFQNDDGKIFASLYALYAGLVFIVAGGILIAPALHRVLHRLHLEIQEEEEQER
jgi:hypothetical protein